MKDSFYVEQTENFYENSYKALGFGAQRIYPNEELCRFMGRNFFQIQMNDRKNIKILETGCGSGANLWMIAKEGFNAYGIDLSEEAIVLARRMLSERNTSANLFVQNMQHLDFENDFFDAIVDVFSSYCLNKNQGYEYLQSVYKKLKVGGIFFSYFPSKRSECFQFSGQASFIDKDTLDSVLRIDAPFSGQIYPFRFMHPREYEELLESLGFTITYSEVVGRTYRRKKEYFEFLVMEAHKNNR